MNELKALLEFSVPLRIDQLLDQGGPLDHDWQEAKAFGDVLAESGDKLLFGEKAGEAKELFVKLTSTLAVMSFAPGGVKLWGLHWTSST